MLHAPDEWFNLEVTPSYKMEAVQGRKSISLTSLFYIYLAIEDATLLGPHDTIEDKEGQGS